MEKKIFFIHLLVKVKEQTLSLIAFISSFTHIVAFWRVLLFALSLINICTSSSTYIKQLCRARPRMETKIVFCIYQRVMFVTEMKSTQYEAVKHKFMIKLLNCKLVKFFFDPCMV